MQGTKDLRFHPHWVRSGPRRKVAGIYPCRYLSEARPRGRRYLSEARPPGIYFPQRSLRGAHAFGRGGGWSMQGTTVSQCVHSCGDRLLMHVCTCWPHLAALFQAKLPASLSRGVTVRARYARRGACQQWAALRPPECLPACEFAFAPLKPRPRLISATPEYVILARSLISP